MSVWLRTPPNEKKKKETNVAIISFLIVISCMQDAMTSFVRVYAKMKLTLNYKMVNVWRNHFLIMVYGGFLIKILSGFVSRQKSWKTEEYNLRCWSDRVRECESSLCRLIGNDSVTASGSCTQNRNMLRCLAARQFNCSIWIQNLKSAHIILDYFILPSCKAADEENCISWNW